MGRIYSGAMGSGKTVSLREKFLELVDGGVKSDNILVLVRSTRDISLWREALRAPVLGKLNIHTYFGFVRGQLTSFWPLLESRWPALRHRKSPVFMTVEASHYLMMQLVEERLALGGFRDVKSTTGDIAIQLIDNLNQASVSGISLDEALTRFRWWGTAVGDEMRREAYRDGEEVMKDFRKNCLDTLSLDYSLMIWIYTAFLFGDEAYRGRLYRDYRCLMVDDLEEGVPGAQDLVLDFMREGKEVYLGYNPQGGHTGFFGAYPEGVAEVILPRCTVEELAPPDARAPMAAFGDGLVSVLWGKPAKGMRTSPLKGQLTSDLRGTVFEKVAEKVVELVKSGTEPGEIAVISPMIDKVLEFDLGRRLSAGGIQMAAVNRSKRLLDQPFAQAMVTLAALAHPRWRGPLNYSSLVQCMGLLLDLDPIRSGVLAEGIVEGGNELPEIDAGGLRQRLGFKNAEKYEELYQWVKRWQGQEDTDLRFLFQRVFAELLAPLLPDEEDLLAVRQVLDSAMKIHKALENYYGEGVEDVDRCFIDLVQKGTLAADMLYRPPVNRGKVVLTTSLNFILNPYIDPVDYQFWMDIGARQWMWSTAKELSNPWLLSRGWEKGQVWDDGIDQSIRRRNLARLMRGLLGKCKEGIYTAHSHLSSRGWEQDGVLLDVFEAVSEEAVRCDD